MENVIDVLEAGISSLTLEKPNTSVGLVYDERMMGHFDPLDSDHPEQSARISCIYDELLRQGLAQRYFTVHSLFLCAPTGNSGAWLPDLPYQCLENCVKVLTSLGAVDLY